MEDLEQKKSDLNTSKNTLFSCKPLIINSNDKRIWGNDLLTNVRILPILSKIGGIITL